MAPTKTRVGRQTTDLAEDADDEDAGREHDGRRHDADEELRQRERNRPDLDGRRLLHLVFRLEEHAVGDHCEEEERRTARHSLHPGEVAPRRPGENREPHVVVAELLPYGRVKEVLEGGEVAQAGDWEDPLHCTVVLLNGKPSVAQEEEPACDAMYAHSCNN